MMEKDLKEKGSTFKHEHAEVNGVKLHYVTSGIGKLIMFLAGKIWHWRQLLKRLMRD